MRSTATFLCGECDESGRRRGAKRAKARVARAMVIAMTRQSTLGGRWEGEGGRVTKEGVEGDGDGDEDGYGDGKKSGGQATATARAARVMVTMVAGDEESDGDGDEGGGRATTTRAKVKAMRAMVTVTGVA